MGVLVLLSSLLHQRYRPDLRFRNSLQRAADLRAAIRRAEDGVFAIKTESKYAPSLYKIRRLLSRDLAEIEKAELESLDEVLEAETKSGNG
jgi:hypothetical protein